MKGDFLVIEPNEHIVVAGIGSFLHAKCEDDLQFVQGNW